MHPDPNNRIDSNQFVKILQFIITHFNNIDINLLSNNNNEYINIFNTSFKQLLHSINIDYNTFNNKNYSYIDFNTNFTKKIFIYLKY